MSKEFIKSKDFPSIFGVSQRKGQQIMAKMRASGRYDKSFIDDGKIHLVRKDDIVEYWQTNND